MFLLVCQGIRLNQSLGEVSLEDYLVWEFATAEDRCDKTDSTDVMLAIILAPTPGTPNTAIISSLGAMTRNDAELCDNEGNRLRITMACPTGSIDTTGLQKLSEKVIESGGEVECLLRSADLSDSDTAKSLGRFISHLQNMGWAITSDSLTRFAVLFDDDTIAEAGLHRKSGSIIRELVSAGCFADLSSVNSADEGLMLNSIYTAFPEGLRSGIGTHHGTARMNRTGGRGLLRICGPTVVNWTRLNDMFLPCIETGVIDSAHSPGSHSAENWLRADVHVNGQPNWKFIKLIIECHADSGHRNDVIVRAESALKHLHSLCDQEDCCRLHFVTAREMANIAYAASSGECGDASRYRDYLVKPYCASE